MDRCKRKLGYLHLESGLEKGKVWMIRCRSHRHSRPVLCPSPTKSWHDPCLVTKTPRQPPLTWCNSRPHQALSTRRPRTRNIHSTRRSTAPKMTFSRCCGLFARTCSSPPTSASPSLRSWVLSRSFANESMSTIPRSASSIWKSPKSYRKFLSREAPTRMRKSGQTY